MTRQKRIGSSQIGVLGAVTGLTRKQVAEYIVDWQDSNSGGTREKAVIALLEEHGLDPQVVFSEGIGSVGEENFTEDLPLLTAEEREQIEGIASNSIMSLKEVLDFFVTERERDPNVSFEEIKKKFTRGPGRTSIRGMAEYLGVSAAGMSQWLVKWKRKPENKDKNTMDGIQAYVSKRSRDNVLKAREDNLPGADKMKIISGFSAEHGHRISAASELVQDISDLMNEYESRGSQPVEALNFAVTTVAIYRSPEIADGVMDALDRALRKIETQLSGVDDFERLDWSQLLVRNFDPEVRRTLRSYGLEVILQGSAMNPLIDQIRDVVLRYGGMGQSDLNEDAGMACRSLETLIQSAILDTSALSRIFISLPTEQRQRIESLNPRHLRR